MIRENVSGIYPHVSLLAKIPVRKSIASMHFSGKLCVKLPARIVINGSITESLWSHNSLCTLMIGVFISSGVQLDIIKWVVSDIIFLQIHRDREQIKQHVFSITSPIWNLWYGFCWPSLGGFHGINYNLMVKEPQKKKCKSDDELKQVFDDRNWWQKLRILIECLCSS